MSRGFQSNYGKYYYDEDRHDNYKQKEDQRRTKGIEEEFEEIVVEKTVYDWNHQGRSATVKEIRVKKRVAPPPPAWSSLRDGSKSSASCKDSSNLSNRGRAKSPTVVEYNHGNDNFTSYDDDESISVKKEEDEVSEGGKRKWTDNSILLRNPLFGSPPSKRLKFVNDGKETVSSVIRLTSLEKSNDNIIKKLENTAASVKSDEGSSSSDEFIKYNHVHLPPLSAIMTTSVSSEECTKATKINQGKILTKCNVTENTHLHCDVKPGYSANNLPSNSNLLPEVGVYSSTSNVRLNEEVGHVVCSEKMNLAQIRSGITLSDGNDVAVAPMKEVVSQDSVIRPTPVIAKPIHTDNPETEVKVSNIVLNDCNTMSEDAGNTSFSSDFSVSTISDIGMLPIDDDVEILFQATDLPLFSNFNFNVYLNGSSNIVNVKSEPMNYVCDADVKQNHNVMDLNYAEDIDSNQKEPSQFAPEPNESKCPEDTNLSSNSFLNGEVIPTSEKSRKIAALIEDLGMAEKTRNVVFDILKSSQSIYSNSNQYKFPFNAIMPLEVAVLRENPSC